MKHSLSILMQNEPGALGRVAGLFAARGYNIDALSVVPTHDPTLSRLNVSLQCDDRGLVQITQQAGKLVDVLQVSNLASALVS